MHVYIKLMDTYLEGDGKLVLPKEIGNHIQQIPLDCFLPTSDVKSKINDG